MVMFETPSWWYIRSEFARTLFPKYFRLIIGVQALLNKLGSSSEDAVNGMVASSTVTSLKSGRSWLILVN